MLDRVLAEIEVPEPAPPRWQPQIRQAALGIYRVFCQLPHVARIALGVIPTGPNALRVTEGLLAIMLSSGVDIRLASWTIDRLILYISADAYQGSLLLAHQPASGQTVEEFASSFLAQLREFYASLPPDHFPHTSGNTAALTEIGGDEQFEFGLDLLLTGVARKLGER